VLPRSSITGTNLRLANSVGVIDCDYRGTIKLRFDYVDLNDSEHDYQVGDRVGQLIILPRPRFTPIVVDHLPETARGNGGFGSSGK
jgi:dUTP pyrophosphatase